MVTCNPEVMVKRNDFENMAVQSWIDILKSSKKTALLNDGEFKKSQNRPFFFRILPVFNFDEYSFIIFGY